MYDDDGDGKKSHGSSRTITEKMNSFYQTAKRLEKLSYGHHEQKSDESTKQQEWSAPSTPKASR